MLEIKPSIVYPDSVPVHISISQFLSDYLWILFVILLGINLFQRKFGEGGHQKRLSSLIIAASLILIYGAAQLIVVRRLNDLLLIPVVLAAAAILYRFRNSVFPYRKGCPGCGGKAGIKGTFFRDSNLCDECSREVEE